MMPVTSHKLERMAIGAICAAFVAWSAFFVLRSSFIGMDGRRYFCLFDDAMISMRYAWQLSHGFGLTWNPGERVEGYSNLLMVLLMSVATLALDKSTAVLSVQVAGVGFMLGIAFLTRAIADQVLRDDRLRRRALLRVLAFTCALAYYPLVYWALMGMETALLTLLLLSGVLAAFRYVATGRRGFLLLAAGCLGLAAVSRNDSVIFAALVGLYLLSQKRLLSAHGTRLADILPAIGIFLLPIVGQLLFRLLYYGLWVPNTYTLKLTGLPLAVRLQGGLEFVKPFLSQILVLLLFSCIEIVFAFTARKALILLLTLSALAYQIFVGGDPWAYWRIMSPTIPLLAILFLASIASLVDVLVTRNVLAPYFLRKPLLSRSFMARVPPLKHASEILLVAASIVVLLAVNQKWLREIGFRSPAYEVIANQTRVKTALALDQVTTQAASVGTIASGSIPYYTGRRAIDFLGKSDPYIASLPPDLSGAVGWNGMTSVPGHNKYDLRYSIKALQPTYVELFVWGRQNLTRWATTRYVTAEYGGVTFSVLRNSPEVLWDKLVLIPG